MSVNIKSHLDSNFWNINMNGELDVAGADKVKEHLNGLVESVVSASICSVTRIVPISEAMLLPTFPAKIKHMMEEENSNKIISRVV